MQDNNEIIIEDKLEDLFQFSEDIELDRDQLLSFDEIMEQF